MAPQIFAIVIGINQYQSKEITNLEGCIRDADSMHAVLSQHSGNAQIRLIKDGAATHAGILQAFEDHLLNNASIKRDDAIVVYFAGKGRRLPIPQGASGRDVDVLVPYDYGETVLGIADSTIHSLLSDLAQNKGANITFILDASFSFYVPRRNVGYRSDTSLIPPSHVYAGLRDSPEYTGFFAYTDPSYVLLAACQQNQLAYESSEGGMFTSGLVTLMRQKRSATWHALAHKLRFEGQDSFYSGVHADTALFSETQYSVIPKLRVFLKSDFVDLNFGTKDSFAQVQSEIEANLVLHRTPGGETVVERLDGLVAQYAARHVTVPAGNTDSLTCVLNKIAHFNYYLGLQPRKTPSLNLPWSFGGVGAAMELYSFQYRAGGSMPNRNKLQNLLKDGVAKVNGLCSDLAYAIKIISYSREPVYPYLFSLDPATYNIQVVYPPPGEPVVEPLRARSLFHFFSSTSSFIVGDGWSGGTPLTLGADATPEDRDAAFFKLILCDKPIDISHISQSSAITSSNAKAGTCPTGRYTPVEIPGIWDTAVATVAIQLGNPPASSPPASKVWWKW